MRCIEPVEPGEEITHSYVDGALTRDERQAELSEQYFFQCTWRIGSPMHGSATNYTSPPWSKLGV